MHNNRKKQQDFYRKRNLKIRIRSFQKNEEEEQQVLQSVKRFFDHNTFDLTQEEISLSPQEQEELRKQNFLASIEFNQEKGKFVATLPKNSLIKSLKSNKKIALAMARTVKKHLEKKGLYKAYNQIIQEHLQRGFLEKIPEEEEPWGEHLAHFLFHFPVLKESDTHPIRIVYNASKKGENGISFNDALELGPNTLNNLEEVLLGWRFGKIAVCADLEKAYLMILIDPKDRNYMKLIWFDEHGQPMPLRHAALAFGLKPAQNILGATTTKHLEEQKKNVNLVQIADKLIKSFYSDNLLTTVNTVEEGKKLVLTATDIFKTAGMNLREWNTNDPDLKEFLKKKDLYQGKDTTNILGMKWNTIEDTLSFKFEFDPSSPESLTKRKVLSLTSKLFDPMFLLTPTIIKPLLAISRLWEDNMDWNDELSDEQKEEWLEAYQDMRKIEDIKIPRLIDVDFEEEMTLNVFSDASKDVAASTAYLVQGDRSYLLGNRFKLRPKDLKNLTIPKMELLGMELATNQARKLCGSILAKAKKLKVKFFSDSQVALKWLKGGAKDVFIKNRVNKVLTGFTICQFFFTPTKDNSCDITSRGCSARDLIRKCIYWHGPDWLPSGLEWGNAEDLMEEETAIALSLIANKDEAYEMLKIDEATNYQHLIRKVAWLMRWFCKKKGQKIKPYLTVKDLAMAEIWLLRMAQEDSYSEVLEYLRGDESGRRPQALRDNDMFLDSNGLLRMKTLFNKGHLSYDQQNPVVLPAGHILTTIMVKSTHINYLHPGEKQTSALVRQKFWIPQGLYSIKKIVKQCITCAKIIAHPGKLPPKPDLPLDRLVALRPLSTIGIDHTGHFLVLNNEEEVKVYLLLLACSATRFVNVEVCFDMSTQGVISALKRHCGIFGRPTTIYCDNHPSYHSAADMLEEFNKTVESPELMDYLSDQGIYFKWSPSLSPHRGGQFEAMVKLLKTALKKKIGRSLLRLEDFVTVVREVQGVVNSRPLYSNSPDFKDGTVITPSHLVFGHSVQQLPSLPLGDKEDPDFHPTPLKKAKEVLMAREKVKEEVLNEFRTRYLEELANRHRQQLRHGFGTQFRKKQVVLMHDDLAKRINWKMGLITKLHKSPTDGQVRSVELKTATGFTTRATNRVYPLELEAQEEVGEVPRKANQHPVRVQPKRRAAEVAKARLKRLAPPEDVEE